MPSPDPAPAAEPTATATAPPRPASRRRLAWALGTLVFAAWVLASGLQDRLIWDDLELIGRLPASVSGADLAAPFGGDFFAQGRDASERHYYRPLVQLSYLAGVALWDAAPLGYAVSNLLLHLTVAGLLFALLTRFGAPPEAAALGTLLFALMPRLTESVFWISGRTDVMASVFVLAALLAQPLRAGGARARAPGRRWLAGGLLFLGLLCKEVAAAGLVALMLHEVVAHRRTRGDRTGPEGRGSAPGLAARLAPLATASLAYIALRLSVLEGAWRTGLELGPAARAALAAEALGRYAVMVLDPLRPALRIGNLFAPREPWGIALGVLTALAGATLLVVLVRRGRPAGEWIGLALAGSAIGLVLHLAPTGSDALAADRFLYVPTIGLVLAGTLASRRLPARRRRMAGAVAAAAVLAFAAADRERARDWSDDTLLWHHASRHADPHDALPHAWLGLALLDRDEPAAALAHFGRAVRIETARPRAHRKSTLILEQLANSSVALSALGRDRDALHAIDQALSFRPGHPPYLEQRARVLARLLRFDDARATLAAVDRAAGPDPARAAWAAELAALQQAAAALPEPSPAEPLATRVARARILGQLGANVAAEAIWRDVADDPAADGPMLLAAAAFHTFRGDEDRARALIERAGRDSAESRAKTEQLTAHLAWRKRHAVEPAILADAAALGAAGPADPS